MSPDAWSEAEKRYVDKKEKSRNLDLKRGVSLLSAHGKKDGHAVAGRAKCIFNHTISRTGLAQGIGNIAQVLSLFQLIANRWMEGRRVVMITIDPKKRLIQ